MRTYGQEGDDHLCVLIVSRVTFAGIIVSLQHFDPVHGLFVYVSANPIRKGARSKVSGPPMS